MVTQNSLMFLRGTRATAGSEMVVRPRPAEFSHGQERPPKSQETGAELALTIPEKYVNEFTF